MFIYVYIHDTPTSNDTNPSPKFSIQMPKLISSSPSDTNEFEFKFEFSCIKPTTPSTDPKSAVSPADEFFLNGRLLPHSFPIQSRISTRRTSSSSSVSTTSRDSLSLVSSRSNSTSSARTSSSGATERKALHKKVPTRERVSNQGPSNRNVGYSNKNCNHGSTFQRLGLLINIIPAPVLDPSVSRRRRRSYGEFGWKICCKEKVKGSGEEKGFCQRVLRSFVKTCKACHAMEEGAAVEDDDLDSFVEFK